jgi:hypothetical protein
LFTKSRVKDADGVAIERLETNGRVEETVDVVQECIITKECVVVVEVAAFLTNGSRLRRKCTAGNGERYEKKARRQSDRRIDFVRCRVVIVFKVGLLTELTALQFRAEPMRQLLF